ncbi:hypothetical protein [Synechocystis sp. LKSZ1]|uniref:hypothetical protein n=1 Tax=Synechocystis sp. LKSZ1 TaxID=3144951 RepID=UPI00336BB246
MHYAIPTNTAELLALRHYPIDEELIAVAIAGVVNLARHQGQSLEDLTAEILAEDPLLDSVQRDWLSGLISQAWLALPARSE